MLTPLLHSWSLVHHTANCNMTSVAITLRQTIKKKEFVTSLRPLSLGLTSIVASRSFFFFPSDEPRTHSLLPQQQTLANLSASPIFANICVLQHLKHAMFIVLVSYCFYISCMVPCAMCLLSGSYSYYWSLLIPPFVVLTLILIQSSFSAVSYQIPLFTWRQCQIPVTEDWVPSRSRFSISCWVFRTDA